MPMTTVNTDESARIRAKWPRNATLEIFRQLERKGYIRCESREARAVTILRRDVVVRLPGMSS